MDKPVPEIELLPRRKAQGYSDEDMAWRREWLRQRGGGVLDKIGVHGLDAQAMRGNIENPIGVAQVPLGVAGPLWVNGEHARGRFYVPLATTEGALVRSYERGMVILSRAGGATARVLRDENRIAPSFFLPDITRAAEFAGWVENNFDNIAARANATTRHGKLLRLACHILGRQVIVNFSYDTGDAQGMNMICRASEAAAEWILAHSEASHYHIFSGYSAEKHPAGSLMAGGKGKHVIAGATIPRAILESHLRVSAEDVQAFWQASVQGQMQSAALGYHGHYANGLSALFIATGQDVANVANCALGITSFEATPAGDLHASVSLPSLTVATVGGGTHQATARECLGLLDCIGEGKARKLAEITAASLLAGEISMAGAIVSGEFVNAHEAYGRNRPGDDAGR